MIKKNKQKEEFVEETEEDSELQTFTQKDFLPAELYSDFKQDWTPFYGE